jgi:hypothetical protein
VLFKVVAVLLLIAVHSLVLTVQLLMLLLLTLVTVL